VPILIIVIGILIFLPGFCGCCGAVRESKCMLITYTILLGILLVLEIAVAIVGFVYSGKLRTLMQDEMFVTMPKYNSDPTGVAVMWDFAQKNMQCCGVHKASDWLGKLAEKNTSTPISCCLPQADGSTSSTCADGVLLLPEKTQLEKIYTSGCMDVLMAYVSRYMYIFGGVVIGIALVEVFGIIFACCLVSAIKSEEWPRPLVTFIQRM
jgi:CD63 antigen